MEGMSLDEPAPTESESETPADSNAPENEELRFDETFEILNKLDQDWSDHFSEAGGAQTYTSEDAEKREHFFNSLTTETSLQEHLLSQASISDMSESQRTAIEYLVGSLDNSGFLNTPLSDLALASGLSLGEMQAAHTTLKAFDSQTLTKHGFLK